LTSGEEEKIFHHGDTEGTEKTRRDLEKKAETNWKTSLFHLLLFFSSRCLRVSVVNLSEI
jgi:hypothetical protein